MHHIYKDIFDSTSYAIAYLTEKQEKLVSIKIKNVIFNKPATIVFWGDGSKTVVKCGENDVFDPEKGLAMAITKKLYGNKGNYYNVIKKWLPKEDKQDYNGPRVCQLCKYFDFPPSAAPCAPCYSIAVRPNFIYYSKEKET